MFVFYFFFWGVLVWSTGYWGWAAVDTRWQIYTDWANHYLEKVKSKRRIQDLPSDVTDGVILADVIEAVGNKSFILNPLDVYTHLKYALKVWLLSK